MTNPRDPDSGLEELLRSTLHGEAEAISPSGDGLARIQARTARHRRRPWLLPIATVGGAAVAAVAGFTAYAVTSAHHDGNDRLLSNPPTVVPSTPQTPASPAVSPSHTPPPAPVFPAQAFYPFASAAQEQSWEAQRGYVAQPWVLDPVASAKNFVKNFVAVNDVTTLMGKQIGARTASVTLGRQIADASSTRPVKVTTVQLQRFGKAWLVIGAADPSRYLKITSPSGGTHVASPVTVTGSAFGVDEAVRVDVSMIGNRFAGDSGHAQFGNGTKAWSTSVSFAPPADPRGAVVVTENSPADGGTSRIVVTGVTFDPEQSGYPQYFYGIKNGRVTKFSSRTGAAISYLTTPAAGGGASDPQVVNGQVYYLSGSGTCTNELRWVSVNGGTSHSAETPDPGYVITGYANRNQRVALYETACDSATSPAAKLLFRLYGNDPPAPASNTATFDGVPPGIVGDPTWSDTRHLDAIVRTGTANSLHDYDSWTAKKALDGATACTGNTADGEPDALAADTAGNLWFAERTGSSMQVVRCIGTTARVMFTVAGNHQPADLAVAGSGGGVLLTDTDGDVWRWNDGGTLAQLKPSVPISQLSW